MIRQLPPSVRSQLRSGVAITSVTQCVEELLLNAVDANSRCIAIRIDLSCFRIQVVDNGTGIAADQLDQVGHRYSTSKCQTVEDLESLGHFGYRGEALASIQDVSYILEVTSRFRCSAQTYCKIFQQGKSLDTVESKIHRPSPGTTVTVHNLFYNLPVRQKSISATLEMESICHRIEALALMQPTLSISLRNDITGSVLIQTHKTNSPLVTFSYLFNHSKTQSMVSVSKTCGLFCIKGYISKESHYRKDLQFIYVNKRLVLKTQLHKLVNRLLKKSLIVRQRQALDTGERFSPSKQADKYPVFVLNIQCPLNAYDITFDPRKTMVEFVDWDALITGIEEMCKEFLCKENLLTVDCFLSEERNEKDNQNHEIDSNEDYNKLLGNSYEQTAFDKIDDEMFNNIRTRGLKSCPIKRLFDNNHYTENADSDRPTANKQSKTENVSAEENVVSNTNINLQNNSACSSVSISNYSDSQSVETNHSASQDISHASKSLLHQNSTLFKKTVLESEKMPFEELKTDSITQMAKTCSSDCETILLQEETDLSKKDSLKSNYINERLNIKKIFVADDDQNEAKTDSIPFFRCEENRNNTSKSIPLFFNEKVAAKHEVHDKNKDSDLSLCSGKNVLSMFRNYKRNSKELSPVTLSQSTRSILDQFRAPQHKRETTESLVDRLKPDIKCLQSLEKRNSINVKLENCHVTAKNSEDICSKERQKTHLPYVNVDPLCETLSVPNNEMLEKLLAQTSSKNSIASKLSKLYKNNNMKSPSKTELLLTPISAEQKEKYKSKETNQNEKKESNLENQKMKPYLNNLDPNPEKCSVKDFRLTEIKESFTSLQEYKSVPSFDLVDPLLNFVVNQKNNPEHFVCKQNLESSKRFVEKKSTFLCSSAFLQTLDFINPQNGKRKVNQKKENHRKSSKDFDFGSLHSFSGDKHDEYNPFGNKNPDRTGHHQIDGNDRDFYDSVLKSTLLSNNKTSSKQPCSDQDENISTEEFSKNFLQSDKSFPMDVSMKKPLLSLDFTLDKESTSLQYCQDAISTNFEQNIFNSNSEDELHVCKWKQSNDETSLVRTQRESNFENEKSCSLTEIPRKVTELEEIITDKSDQIILSPVSDLYFDDGNMLNERDCIFENEAVVHNVSVDKTDKTGKEKSSICHSSAFLMPPPAPFSNKGEKYTKHCQEQRSNQKPSDTAEYLHQSPKILNDDSKMSNKSTSHEINEVLSDCPQMFSKECEMLNDSSKLFEETSTKTSESKNDTPETLNETSCICNDAYKILNNTLKVMKDILKSPIDASVISSNPPEIINNSSEATIKTCKMSSNANNQCNQCDIVSHEATTDQSELVLHTSSIINEGPGVKQGFINDNKSPSSCSTLFSSKLSSPSVSETLTHKTNLQTNTSISTKQNSPLRKTDDFSPSLTDQPQRQDLPLHRSSLSNCSANDSESTVKDPVRVNHFVDLKSNYGSQQSEAECVPKSLSSQEVLMEIPLSRENSRNSQIHNKTEIQTQVSSSFSKEVDISQNVEKSSELSNSALKSSSGIKHPHTLVLQESSPSSKPEECSHGSTSFKSSHGISMDSHKIQPTKNVDHLENSERILLEDPLPAKGTLFQPGTSDAFDLDLNKNEQNDENLFESNPKNLGMKGTENASIETDESHFQNPNVGCCNDEEKESEPIISDEYETDLTLKLWRNWKNPVFQVSETDVFDIWSNNSVQQKLHRVTHSCQFTKEMLSQMETIGQVDNKFIACIVKSQDESFAIPDHLLMIDQHAAHERIRLEQLTADMYQLENSEENEKLSVKFSQIFPPWTFSLSDKEIRIVSSFLDEFSKIGLQLKIHQEDNTIEIHTVPSCIVAREASERKHNRNTVAMDLVLALIKEEIELLHDTHGAHSTLPKTIHKLLCSQACHGAIKFNDPLTLVECQHLLKMLLKCKLPFQCAHGRPSVIPLLNLQHFKQIFTKSECPKIDLKKFKRKMEKQEKMNS